MIGLYRQSTSAQIGRAEVVVARSCDAITNNYRFYMAGWLGPAPELNDTEFRQGLMQAVQIALRDQPGVEGGIWQADAGSLS